MPHELAGRVIGYCADCTRFAIGEDREFAAGQIRRQVLGSGNVPTGFAFFQSPFIFGSLNLTQIVDGRIFHGRIARLDEIGDCDGQH